MRRHAFFIGLFVIIAVARFMILLTSQTHVHSDEAIIGLMGKHILEGRYFPFYMYGQPYNAGAAWEAYLAAIAFAVFGVSVIPLKSCILVLSLLCLVLFYWMCLALYDQRTALLAAIVFAVTPSLLKWHFQVRGYSWYFLSIPILTMLFTSVSSACALGSCREARIRLRVFRDRSFGGGNSDLALREITVENGGGAPRQSSGLAARTGF